MYGKKIFVLKGDMLNAHFYKYAKKVVYQFDFFKMNLLHKSKMKCWYVDVVYVRD